MKTVKIPTCANPFIVIVNGQKYIYPAGATMEVPDDVAEVIEQHEKAKTEPAPVPPPFVPGPSGGGGEVVDLSTLFDFAASIMDGGSSQVIEGDFMELTNQFKKGTTKVKARLGEIICTVDVNAMIIPIDNGEAIQFNNFVENNFSLLWLETMITPTQLGYRVQKVSTQPYDPS
jgi:hypothetical protein